MSLDEYRVLLEVCTELQKVVVGRRRGRVVGGEGEDGAGVGEDGGSGRGVLRGAGVGGNE